MSDEVSLNFILRSTLSLNTLQIRTSYAIHHGTGGCYSDKHYMYIVNTVLIELLSNHRAVMVLPPSDKDRKPREKFSRCMQFLVKLENIKTDGSGLQFRVQITFDFVHKQCGCVFTWGREYRKSGEVPWPQRNASKSPPFYLPILYNAVCQSEWKF